MWRFDFLNKLANNSYDLTPVSGYEAIQEVLTALLKGGIKTIALLNNGIAAIKESGEPEQLERK